MSCVFVSCYSISHQPNKIRRKNRAIEAYNDIDNFARQNRHSSRRVSSRSVHIDDTDVFLSRQDPRVTSSQGASTPHATTDYSTQKPSVPSPRVSIGPQSQYDRHVTVVEPSPCATPALALMGGGGNNLSGTDSILSESTQNLLSLNGSSLFQAGRASAPPHLFESHSIRNRQLMSKQIPFPQSGVSKPSRTPIPSFQNAPGAYSGHTVGPTPRPLAVETEKIDDPAFQELSPFLWEENKSNNQKATYPSRALAIFGLAGMQLSEVKTTLEAFGSLLYIRSEFFASKGVLFIAYHDLRSSRHAAGELNVYLRQMIDGGAQKTSEINVMYCLSLTSSSERDDSTLVISNLPPAVREQSVRDLLESTYGALRSVHREPAGCYIIEFFDLQDASQALLEIQSTMPWGAAAVISTKLRQDYERKKGQELFALIGRWRQENIQNVEASRAAILSESVSPPAGAYGVPSSISARVPQSPSSQDGQTNSTGSSTQSVAYHPTAQVVVGHDGLSYIVMQQPQGYPAARYGSGIPQQMQHAQHVVSGHHGTYIGQQNFEGQGYWVQQPHNTMHPHGMPYGPGSASQGVFPHQVVDPQQHHQQYPGRPSYAPVLTGHGHAVDSSISPGNTSTGKRSVVQPKQDDNSAEHLALSIQAVKQGMDTRTSLMVRNIPNKYTQTMLLSEFGESGHGPGKIDFFYLPIDFRNKCNRGYAFVNFFDYRDILSFYDTYNGKSWKIFKSEKICCITYARIQGQEGMMKRFQNSALMEKDQAYRPLVFSPNGDVVEETEFLL